MAELRFRPHKTSEEEEKCVQRCSEVTCAVGRLLNARVDIELVRHRTG